MSKQQRSRRHHSPHRACQQTGKRRFKDQKEAKQTRHWQMTQGDGFRGVLIRIYQCSWCNGWHFTSKEG